MEINTFQQVAAIVAFAAFIVYVVVDKIRNGKQFMEVLDAFTGALEQSLNNEVTMEAVRGAIASVPPEIVKTAIGVGDALKMLTPDNIDRLINALQALATKEVQQPPAPEVKPPLPGTDG